MEAPAYKDIFEQLFKNLQRSGIHSDHSRLGFRFYILFTSISLMIIEEFSFFVVKASSENFLKLTSLVPSFSIGVRSVLKITSIAQKRRKIFELINSLDELYSEMISDKPKRDLVCGEINQVKSLTKYYFVLNLILNAAFNLSTLLIILYEYLSKGIVVYILPYPIIVPFSTEVFQNWLILYLQAISCGIICILYVTTVDGLYCNISAQVCANYKVLSYDIKNLNISNAHTLPEIIKKHQYMHKLSETLEDIFTTSNFFNILVGSVEICALGFNLLFGEWTEVPAFVLFLLSELVQILIMSAVGQNIITESIQIREAAYCCDWYNMDQKSKKCILIIMIRSQKPQILTAYKFSTICYETFTKIISTSWTYFTILRTIYAK